MFFGSDPLFRVKKGTNPTHCRMFRLFRITLLVVFARGALADTTNTSYTSNATYIANNSARTALQSANLSASNTSTTWALKIDTSNPARPAITTPFGTDKTTILNETETSAPDSMACCDDFSCSDNSICPCCGTQTCWDMTYCTPCCIDQSCTDISVCISPIAAVYCDPSLQKNLAPTKFVIFQASEGDSLSLGDTAFLMARFPDGVCNMLDPGTLGDQCVPKIQVALRITADGRTQNGKILEAARDLNKLQSDYNVQFSDQPEFLDQLTNGFSYPWVFVLQVEAGISTTDLDVNWMDIPKACNRNVTFNNTRLNFPNHELIPNVSIDTLPPQVVSVFSTAKGGNYTAGSFLDIVIKFSKDVDFSPLPDIYSQVSSSNIVHSISPNHFEGRSLGRFTWMRKPPARCSMASLTSRSTRSPMSRCAATKIPATSRSCPSCTR